MREKVRMVTHYNWGNKIEIYQESKVRAEIVDKEMDPIRKMQASDSIKESDAVFFHTTSKIPRYKFSKFCEGTKIRRVLSLDKATVCVLNKDSINLALGSIGYRHKYYVLGENVLDSTGSVTLRSTSAEGPIICRTETYKQMLTKWKTLPDPTTLEVVEYYTNYNGSDNLTRLGNGFADLQKALDMGIRLVEDNTLNKQMSAGSITIDETNYDEFCQMLASKDKSTVTTAMEIIANSDYTNSEFYIGLLLNRYASVVSPYMTATVNLKNFFNFFKGIAWNGSVHGFLESLRTSLKSKGTLDDYKEKFIRESMTDYVNRTISHAGVKVREIFFKDEKIPE
jgi:hypothetical protein